ncbi:hypothetical protein Dimus_030777, partial [Dionaea muscipula]
MDWGKDMGCFVKLEVVSREYQLAEQTCCKSCEELSNTFALRHGMDDICRFEEKNYGSGGATLGSTSSLAFTLSCVCLISFLSVAIQMTSFDIIFYAMGHLVLIGIHDHVVIARSSF